MSWQLGATAVLAIALMGGFAWYERTRPDARLVALIATLAAFAALGRIAFAAIPNVKPTTDIVLITGYTLGGAPGFAVGALAGLTSNFFFGQGPWTVWQMAAWGLTGLIGATLAVITRRRTGRVPLAAVCCVTGFAFTALQDVGDWVNFSDHSASQLGIYVGQGLGFDALHAAACLGFALAFGPALRRSIERFALRLRVQWRPAGAPVLAALAALGLAGALAASLGAPGAARGAAPAGPTRYLLGAQNPDGGFGAMRGEPSSPLFSGWAALGLASVGRSPAAVSGGTRSLLDYVASQPTGDPGSLERTILVVSASGRSPRHFAGRNLIAALGRDIKPDGSVNEQVNWTSFEILALRSAGLRPPARSVSWLLRQPDRDGGFNFAGAGATSDVDDTGAALEALAGAGGSAPPVRRRAVAYIRRAQERDGGFPSDPGSGSNAQSTGWAIQGLLAAGVAPASLRRRGAPSPFAYLRSLIASDGHIRYSRSSDQTPVWVTGQVLMAMAGRPLPLRAPAESKAASVPRPTRTHSGSSGGGSTATIRPALGRRPAKVGLRARPREAWGSAATLSAARALGFAAAVVLAPVGV